VFFVPGRHGSTILANASRGRAMRASNPADQGATVTTNAGFTEPEFVLSLARRVAERHEEHGTQISPAEQAALDDLSAALCRS
jgi:hypothetical protein